MKPKIENLTNNNVKMMCNLSNKIDSKVFRKKHNSQKTEQKYNQKYKL